MEPISRIQAARANYARDVSKQLRDKTSGRWREENAGECPHCESMDTGHVDGVAKCHTCGKDFEEKAEYGGAQGSLFGHHENLKTGQMNLFGGMDESAKKPAKPAVQKSLLEGIEDEHEDRSKSSSSLSGQKTLAYSAGGSGEPPTFVDFQRHGTMEDKYRRIAAARIANGLPPMKYGHGASWNEADHPRGNPSNAGEFRSKHDASQHSALATNKAKDTPHAVKAAAHHAWTASGMGNSPKAAEFHRQASEGHAQAAQAGGEFAAEHKHAAQVHAKAAEMHGAEGKSQSSHDQNPLPHSEGTGFAFHGTPTNPQGVDSATQYLVHGAPEDPGEWKPEHFSPERRKLHDRIIQAHFAKASPVPNPEAHMMGGGPASGKSVAIESGHVKIPDNHVAIDPDAIKGMLPEYKQRIAAKDHTAAAFSHEESSYLSKQVLSKAAREKYNMMMDGTGDSGLKKLAKKIQDMRAGGQKVIAHYVTVDTNTALQRNRDRAAKTGRLPPEDFVKEVHKTISQIVPEAIKQGLFDEFHIYDTNGDGAKLIADARAHQLQVHDPSLWDRFLSKAGE